ncbi:hypothetical protein ACFC1R_31070 [Kitasatospora sp. NPDC056138]|uniref:hypothetical protein n=1 Tax=Kitasatospora sp. NPDC056138 TaxID=3345724 RepID=UPI0035D5B776
MMKKAADRARAIRRRLRMTFRPTPQELERWRAFQAALVAADRAIVHALEKSGTAGLRTLYAADVIEAGRQLGTDVAEYNAHAALYHRLVARGLDPAALPLWDFHTPTPLSKQEVPCGQYDPGIPGLPWCRRCGWESGDHVPQPAPTR